MGSHSAGKLNNAWIWVLEGPEDDLLGRNMSPWHIYNCIQNKCCVNWLTLIIYLHILTLRDGKLIIATFPLQEWLRERIPVSGYSTLPVLFYSSISTTQNWTVSVTLQPHCPADRDSGIRWIRFPVGLQPVAKRNTCVAVGNLILSSP